jgi:hypothetical protein
MVAVRAPRYGDEKNTKWPEVKDPINAEPGTDLVLLHPDGAEEVLVAGGPGAVLDPCVSFDGQWVYYARLYDVTKTRSIYGRNVPIAGSDLFKINVTTRQTVQLTYGEWTPNASAGQWPVDLTEPVPRDKNSPGHKPFNLGVCPLPGKKIVFTSSRNSLLPTREYTYPNLQLFVLDEVSGMTEQIGSLNLGSALHPTVLMDGRVMFSSYESQGRRDQRLWGLWVMNPDGTNWGPLLSAFADATAFHFQTQLVTGHVAVVGYYNQNNNGFGTVFRFLPCLPGRPCTTDAIPPFGMPDPKHPSNPFVQGGYFNDGKPKFTRMGFSPRDFGCLTCFAGHDDHPSALLQGEWAGKVTHPSAAPGTEPNTNDVLLVYSPGPANDKGGQVQIPRYQGQLALLKGGYAVYWSRELVILKSDPRYNYQQPRALVPYKAIFGKAEPDTIPRLANDGSRSPALPPGTPYGIVGTSSHLNRDTSPGVPPRPEDDGSNWIFQGADTQDYTDADIAQVRLLIMEPYTSRLSGPDGTIRRRFFTAVGNERLRILADLPLRKHDANGQPILDGYGNPDTSWAAVIPADVPFTFQTLAADGSVLNMSQTWHQLRPGEVRTDCGGCHAHAHVGVDFAKTMYGRTDTPPIDLTTVVPRSVEFHRDIVPILQALRQSTDAETIVKKVVPYQSRKSPLMQELPQASPDQRRIVQDWIALGNPISLHEKYGYFQHEILPTLDVYVQRQQVQPPPPVCPAGCVPSPPPAQTTATLLVGAASVYQRLDPSTLRVMVDTIDRTGELQPQPGNRWALALQAGGQGVIKAHICEYPGANGQRPCTSKTLAVQW